MLNNNPHKLERSHRVQHEVPTHPIPVHANGIKEGSRLWHLSRVVAGLGVVVFGLIASPFIVMAKIGVTLRDEYRIKFQPNSMLASTRTMKATEESDKLGTMKKVLEGHPGLIKGAENTNFQGKEKLDQTRKNIAVRCILRELQKAEKLTPELLDVIKEKGHEILTLEDDGNVKWNLEKAQLGDTAVAVLNAVDLEKISGEVISRTQVDEAQISEFQSTMKDLVKTLNTSEGKDPASVNKKFIKELRKALNSPVYQALKDETSEPAVKLLHHFASALWNKAPSMDAYLAVGNQINEKLQKPSEKGETHSQSKAPGSQSPSTGADLANKLRTSRKLVAKEHWTDHGNFNRAMYAIAHPRQAMGSMASEGGIARILPSLFGRQAYDSHGELSNNPSLQGVTEIALGEADAQYSATVNNCYGGSPTIDNAISPEFLAVLQAAENNQLSAEKDRDPDIPQMINYTNLQNLHKGAESSRSRAIMELNKRYPLSFSGITLSKDSNLYMMPNKADVVWKTPSQFGVKMKNELMRSFEPAATGHGYHFPGGPSKWEGVFTDVIESANKHFEAEQLKVKDPKALQGAYQEYVYSMLGAVIEMESISTLKERGIKAPKIMAIKACKENIDRGGMENVKYLYTRCIGLANRDNLLLGCMHSRPLSARDRVILESRMPQVLNFMETVEPDQFQNGLNNLFQKRGYQMASSTFTPALKPTP